MLMGAVYLTYSAYYVSVEVNGVKTFISMIINGIYLLVFFLIVANSLQVLRVLRLHHSFLAANEVQGLQETIEMKVDMMRKFLVIATAYFLFELFIHGVVPIARRDQDFNDFNIILHQFYDFAINCLLLFVFRPRLFPEYFSLGILEAPLLGVRPR
eukprot:CAMPEP_0202967764 /NCGR_PEP_ID=MMETSP1396-20130829/12761_1 /ASSEMBLY_ACC=CAM_ASM_000872 /TAXON_ID= /ORGANISM="Pseudokeronopsis sp., Strain Brazil" /LENGTH=155 /DNA_ID=CAMNT_0049693213 /DNA_START=484 /DNA_END=951 /DNA_ORIENTATION=-